MTLSTNEIVFLSGMYPEKTQLSLFSNIKTALDGTEEESLIGKGVYLDKVLSPAAEKILGVAAGARRYSRIVLKNGFCVLEKYVYKKDDESILVENDAGELLLSIAENFSETVSEFSEFTGISRIKSSNMQALMTSAEIMVFLAIMDLHRKVALEAYLGYSETNSGFRFSDIVSQLDNAMKNSLVQMMKKNYNYIAPHTEMIEDILGKFINENYVVSNKGYELADEYAVFADNFLIPDTLVVMEMFNLDENDQILSASALCIGAGTNNIACFIFSKDEVEISSISAMQLLQMIENFLGCPEITL